MFCVICERFVLTEEEAKRQQEQEEAKQSEKTEQSKKIEQSEKTKQSEKKKEPVKEPKRQVIEENEPERTAELKEQEVIKRQRTKQYDLLASKPILSTLSAKMDYLNERVKTSVDSVELTQLFKSIKACANAIKACVEAESVCNKNV